MSTTQAQARDDDDIVHDDLIDSTQGSSALTNLFDLRVIIGGLFTLYGVYLTIYGIFDGPEAIDKAAGVRINLWTGLALLAMGLAFIAWARIRPLVDVMAEGQADDATAEFLEPEVRQSRGHAGNPSH